MADQSFPTRRKYRKKRKKKITVLLESDIQIKKNVEKVAETISNMDIPVSLLKILNDKSHLVIYFKKLKKSIPVLGKPLTESIQIPAIRKKLEEEKNIKNLYKYQEEVTQQILKGNNLIISAPTGLGKTEAFLLPIIYSIIIAEPNPNRRQGPTALLIYPTKALAADQREKIDYYCSSIGITVEILDGDTPQDKRRQIYQKAPDILITNPDMIHYHLNGNLSFQALISKLRFLVLDEIHLCVGAYGTNVLWIIRRLRRFAPGLQCIGASATISNAKNFAELIFDKPTVLVSSGTVRKADLYLTILYPKERSNLSTIAQVTEYFVQSGNRTLVFLGGHRSTESLNMVLRSRGRIKSQIHRAGLSYAHRSKVEQQFKDPQYIGALVSTPTLELGIDVGDLTSVVSSLTTQQKFLQRIGRAGRKGQDSYATLILRGDDPISAFYARYPEKYLTDLEPSYVEPNNPFVAKKQLIAMLLDKPLTLKEAVRYENYVNELKNKKIVKQFKDKIMLIDRNKAQSSIRDYSIRGIGKSVTIMYNNGILGSRVLPIALSELHKGALYLHGGRSYKVQNYSEKIRIAKVSVIRNNNEKTQALRTIFPQTTSIIEEIEVIGLNAAYCQLELTETVHGYLKQNIFSNKVTGIYNLEKPISYKYSTMGFILSLPRPISIISQTKPLQTQEILGGSYHAIEHVLIESGNSLTGGGANSIGGIAMGDTGVIFVYDGTIGGSGLSKLLFDSLEKGLSRSLKILEDCPCKSLDGCPRCTYSYYCGNNNQPLNKIGAIETLRLVGDESTKLKFNFEGIETFV